MKPTTISIGVVAYNEERTIESVLNDIASQHERGWILKEILVYCDGCTDNTEAKARSVKGRRVQVINSHIRKGKTARLQQMFRVCSGDILVMFDADIELAGLDVVTRLIAPFVSDERVMLVGGNSRPYPPQTFTERAVSSTFEVFDRSRKEIRGGHNVFGCTGSVLAIRQSFSKTVQFPPIVNEDAYLYLLCIENDYTFRYVENAVVYYRLPTRLTDHIRQMLRSTPASVNVELTPYFADLVSREFHRPFTFYARSVLGAFLKNPLGTSAIAILNIMSIAFKPIYPLFWRYYDLRWFTAATTKWSMSKKSVPKKILSYRFIRMVNPDTVHRSFVYAQYRGPRGRNAFAKMWTNTRKNFDYHSLVNEKNWYVAFEKMRKTERKNHGAKGIHIPNYIGWEEGPHFAALLTQFVNGHTAEFLPASQQYSKILLVRKFLHSITPAALNLKGPGNQMNIRHHHLAILAFPLFLFKTRKYPFVLKNFTDICLKYLKSLKLLFISFPTVIAHKSIEPKNIIIADRKTYLIDFQLAVFSNPIIDVVETLFFCWSNKKLRQLAIEHDAESTMRSKTYKDLFRFLTLYAGIHQLSEGVVEPQVIEEYLSFSLNL